MTIHRRRTYNRHRTTDIIGYTVVGILGAIVLGIWLGGMIYIQACTDNLGHNACATGPSVDDIAVSSVNLVPLGK